MSNTTDTWRLEQWFPEIDKVVQDKLRLFNDEVLKANKGLNLISDKTTRFSDVIHFADSILGCRVIMKDQPNLTEIADIGSGAGFPGIVFALMYPNIKVALIEIDVKRAEFLKHIVSVLALKNVSVVNSNVESLPDSSIKVAMSRGFSAIAKSILVTRKVFAVGGKYYHFKSEEWASEVTNIPSQLCSFWLPGLIGEYRLPIGEIKFAIVRTERIK